MTGTVHTPGAIDTGVPNREADSYILRDRDAAMHAFATRALNAASSFMDMVSSLLE